MTKVDNVKLITEKKPKHISFPKLPTIKIVVDPISTIIAITTFPPASVRKLIPLPLLSSDPRFFDRLVRKVWQNLGLNIEPSVDTRELV